MPAETTWEGFKAILKSSGKFWVMVEEVVGGVLDNPGKPAEAFFKQMLECVQEVLGCLGKF